MEQVLAIVAALAVTLFAVGVVVAAMAGSAAVRKELRSHLEREGWSSLHSPFFTIRPGYRGSWRGREALGRFRARQKSTPPELLIQSSTGQLERMRISRAATSRFSAIANFAFGLPPRLDLDDERFDVRARSREMIDLVLRDDEAVTLLEEFLRSPRDRIDTKNGTLQLRRELQDRKAGSSFSLSFRPPPDEIERTLYLAHRILERLTARGF